MKKQKTTAKQFEYFRKMCMKYIDLFELNNWEVHFGHNNHDPEARATCSTNLSGYIATITLIKDWGVSITSISDEHLEDVARHEVIHLLMARYKGTAGGRYISRDELVEADEETVRKIENILNKCENGQNPGTRKGVSPNAWVAYKANNNWDIENS